MPSSRDVITIMYTGAIRRAGVTILGTGRAVGIGRGRVMVGIAGRRGMAWWEETRLGV
jgi:hypothetical protein